MKKNIDVIQNITAATAIRIKQKDFQILQMTEDNSEEGGIIYNNQRR